MRPSRLGVEESRPVGLLGTDREEVGTKEELRHSHTPSPYTGRSREREVKVGQKTPGS